MTMDCNIVAEEDEEAMARAAGPKPVADPKKVGNHVSSLESAGLDRPAFTSAFDAIRDDKSLNVVDVIAIAERYRRGGSRVTSRKAAMASIEKRFLEMVRQQAQKAQAARARPW